MLLLPVELGTKEGAKVTFSVVGEEVATGDPLSVGANDTEGNSLFVEFPVGKRDAGWTALGI